MRNTLHLLTIIVATTLLSACGSTLAIESVSAAVCANQEVPRETANQRIAEVRATEPPSTTRRRVTVVAAHTTLAALDSECP